MVRKRVDLIGQTFGRLRVIELAGVQKRGQSIWRCQCECGRFVTVHGTNLKSTKSCGCWRRKICSDLGRQALVHGEARYGKQSPEYRCWRGIRERCLNSRLATYKYYGGRGIMVCERWLGEHGFENFVADMGRRPSPSHSIDRYPDKDGDYEPSNCRWATKKEQAANRRDPIKRKLQIRADIRRLLETQPHSSNSLIARMTGTTHHTVGAVRKEIREENING